MAGVPKSSWAPSGGYKNAPLVKAPPAPSKKVTTTASVAPRATYQTFYDPSRVIDLDKLKIVDDMRVEGSERGETQEGDDGTLGPGSNGGAFIGTPGVIPVLPVDTKKPGLTGAQLALLAVASYFIFGG